VFRQTFRTPKKPQICSGAADDPCLSRRPGCPGLADGTLFGEGVKTASRKSCWKSATCTHRALCPRRVQPLHRAIKTNLLFFERGTPTKIRLVLRPSLPTRLQELQQPSRMRIDEFAPRRSGGASAKKPTKPGRSASRTSRPAAKKLDIKTRGPWTWTGRFRMSCSAITGKRRRGGQSAGEIAGGTGEGRWGKRRR